MGVFKVLDVDASVAGVVMEVAVVTDVVAMLVAWVIMLVAMLEYGRGC